LDIACFIREQKTPKTVHCFFHFSTPIHLFRSFCHSLSFWHSAFSDRVLDDTVSGMQPWVPKTVHCFFHFSTPIHLSSSFCHSLSFWHSAYSYRVLDDTVSGMQPWVGLGNGRGLGNRMVHLGCSYSHGNKIFSIVGGRFYIPKNIGL
jgi:hypothetical protein